jgi:hypothetical protein
MNKAMVKRGAILLVAGLAIIAAITVYDYMSNNTCHNFNEIKPGIYSSSPLSMTDSKILEVFSKNLSASYLLPTADLALINSSNLKSYSVPPVTASEVEVGGTFYSVSNGYMFAHLSGSYTIVIISSAYPVTQFSIINASFPYSLYPYFMVIAILSFFAFLIIGSIYLVDGLI